MSGLAQLPTRRMEGWRWSDLRAAADGLDAGIPDLDGMHPFEAIARGQRGPRWISVAPGASASVIEDLAGENDLEARYLQVSVEAGGRLDLVIRQRGDARQVQGARIDVVLGAGARMRQFVLAEGARFARIETFATTEGEGAVLELGGAYLAGARRHADLTSQVTLAAGGAEVRQLVRGAARRGGRGVFQGKFLVQRAAQKTDARMQHNALLLDDGAEVFAKPELEIYADDVQCAHGNTAGQLDEAAVFYARQRGIPAAEARAMLTRAFLIEAVPDWLGASVRAEVEGRIEAWLAHAAEVGS